MAVRICAGHLAVHEDEAEGVDQIAGVSGGVAGLGGRHAESAGGAEVDGEVGDLVVDEVVGKREAEDGAGGVLLAELGRVRGGAGDDVVGREEVEDAAGGVGLFAESVGVVAEARVVADAGGVGEAEAAEDVGHVEHGLAEVAAVGSGVGVAGAGFGIFEDGANDGLHVSADAAAVVGEDGGDAGDVGGAGIAGDQMLDELAADERADVGVGEDVGQRAGEILLGGLAGRQDGAVEENLGGGVMCAFDGGHGGVVVGGVVGKLGGGGRRWRWRRSSRCRRGRRPGPGSRCRRGWDCRWSRAAGCHPG